MQKSKRQLADVQSNFQVTNIEGVIVFEYELELGCKVADRTGHHSEDYRGSYKEHKLTGGHDNN
jgi:hypothetical protein